MMTGDPKHPQGEPDDAHATPSDPARTLELLQELARQQARAAPAPEPAPLEPPAPPRPESPLEELARLIGQKPQTEPPDVDESLFAEPEPPREEPPRDEPPPPRRPRRRRARALLPNRRATLALAALLAVAVVAVGAVSVWWAANAPRTPETAAADVLAKAMADCDVEAKKTPDTLQFLVIPLMAGPSAQKWSQAAVQQAGDTYLLLSSQDALGGLRDGSLVAYPDTYAFSIVEPTTGTRHSWPPTSGPTKFSEADAGDLSTIKLGFAFGNDSEPKLSSEFVRQKGDCYWVSVLVRK